MLALAGIAHGAAKEIEGERAPANTPCPTPEEARAKMTVPEGYEVRCFAHEPMVQNPVAMTWDTRGRLWVVELYEYPEGTPLPVEKRPFGQPAKDDQYRPVPEVCLPSFSIPNRASSIPKDRIIILEDTDNDGVADKRTVFVEGLDLASAIICGDDGIYVGQQPHLLHFKDSNHDDVPDEWRVVLTGFGREDTHELVNSFTWGPDGWLYMTHGVFTNSKVRRPGQPESEGFKFDAGIGRCRPMNREKAAPWEFEVFADGTSNPWGTDYDAAGNFFVSACVIDHFFHMAPGGIYVRQGGAPENPYAYELLPSIVKHKHFRAAYAGIQIYQGGVYPRDTWGHAFIGNIHDNAIHEEVLTPVGASFKCEPRRDFLRANDGWFRPVSTQTGPDGNLWVMDWCDKYPCYQNAKANPEGVDRARGRIWRVVWTGIGSKDASPSLPSRPTKDMDLAKLDTPALVKLLEHPNSWMRRKARRVLVERKDPASEALIWDLVAMDAANLDPLWTLLDARMLDEKKLKVLSDRASPVAHRLWAARAVGELGRSFEAPMEKQVESFLQKKAAENEAVGETMRKVWQVEKQSALRALMLSLYSAVLDTDPSVKAASAVAMRQLVVRQLTVNDTLATNVAQDIRVTPLLAGLRESPDSSGAFAVWMALEPLLVVRPSDILSELAKLAANANAPIRTLTHKSMRRLCDTRDAKNLDLALDFLTKVKAHDVLLAHALDGIEKGQEGGIIKPTKDFSALFAEFMASTNADVQKHAQNLATLWGDEAAIGRIVASLVEAKTPVAQRITAVQTLRKVKSAAVTAAFVKVLSTADQQPSALVVEVIRASADAGGDAFIEPLTQLAASKDYGTQLAAFGALSNRESWTHAMLDAIAAKKISAVGFPASVRRQLATSKDKGIRDHAFKVLGAWKDSSEDMKALIAAKKAACLTGEPDIAQGKLLFQTTCMVCHVFHGGGQKVGPDLIGSGRSNLDAILANVIDPNQIIGNGYENFSLSTKDNRTLMGRVMEDTPSHVKLQMIGGAETVVPRDQIAKLENTHQSLMPMGFGGLPDAQFRDLIWYVLAPPEEGPLTPEKKKLLSTSIDAAPAKPKAPSSRAIDWESVSLWNPKWKVSAPDFERTPMKLADYHGRSNVLLMHPFPDKKTPTSLEQKLVIDPAKSKLKVSVAADDRGDWKLVVRVNGEVIKEQAIDHEKPRWKDLVFDLSNYAGKEATVRLEGHGTGWSWEFGYWQDVRWE
jgi:putative membrane-bound dehydrogenase-like protein